MTTRHFRSHSCVGGSAALGAAVRHRSHRAPATRRRADIARRRRPSRSTRRFASHSSRTRTLKQANNAVGAQLGATVKQQRLSFLPDLRFNTTTGQNYGRSFSSDRRRDHRSDDAVAERRHLVERHAVQRPERTSRTCAAHNAPRTRASATCSAPSRRSRSPSHRTSWRSCNSRNSSACSRRTSRRRTRRRSRSGVRQRRFAPDLRSVSAAGDRRGGADAGRERRSARSSWRRSTSSRRCSSIRAGTTRSLRQRSIRDGEHNRSASTSTAC